MQFSRKTCEGGIADNLYKQLHFHGNLVEENLLTIYIFIGHEIFEFMEICQGKIDDQ